MKLTKYIATALAGMALVACGNDYRDIQGDVKIEYNTLPDVVVNLAEPTVSVNENTGLFTVPVYVQGNRNGYVTVTIECVETGNDPAIAGRHYLLTSDNINIAQDDEEGEFELSTIDFRGLDPNRTFDVKIIDVKGATVGQQATTLVTINDKGSAPKFQDLPGAYFISSNTYNQSEGLINLEYFAEVNMTITEDNGDGSGTVTVSGVMGQFSMELYYDYDQEEKYGELVMNYGTSAGGPEAVWVGNTSGSIDVAPVRGKWNVSYNAITFGNVDSMFGVGAFENGVFAGWYGYNNAVAMMNGFTLIKINEVDE